MNNVRKLREAGFTNEEIDAYYRPTLKQAGFSDEEINIYLGPKPPQQPVAPTPQPIQQPEGFTLPPPTKLFEPVAGAAEAAGKFVLDLANWLGTSADVAMDIITSGALEKARDIVRPPEEARPGQAPPYEPKTPTGRAITEMIGKGMEPISEAWEDYYKQAVSPVPVVTAGGKVRGVSEGLPEKVAAPMSAIGELWTIGEVFRGAHKGVARLFKDLHTGEPIRGTTKADWGEAEAGIKRMEAAEKVVGEARWEDHIKRLREGAEKAIDEYETAAEKAQFEKYEKPSPGPQRVLKTTDLGDGRKVTVVKETPGRVTDIGRIPKTELPEPSPYQQPPPHPGATRVPPFAPEQVPFTRETPGRGVPIPAQAPVEPTAPVPPRPTAPPRTSTVFSRLRERPTPKVTITPERTEQVDTLYTRFLDEHMGRKHVDTTADLRKMERFRRGEKVPTLGQRGVVEAVPKAEEVKPTVEKVKTIRSEITQKINSRTTYGIREEIVDVASQKAVWSNSHGQWFVSGKKFKKGEKVKLDANEILIPQRGIKETRKWIESSDAPVLPLYRGSFEASKLSKKAKGKEGVVSLEAEKLARAGEKISRAEQAWETLDEIFGKTDIEIKEEKPKLKIVPPKKAEVKPKPVPKEKPVLSHTTQLIKSNKAVIRKGLQEALDSFGFNEFEHRYNEGKVSAIMYRELVDSGMDKKAAKEMVSKQVARYRDIYKSIVEQEKARIEKQRGGELDLSNKSVDELEKGFMEAIENGNDKGDPVFDAYHDELHRRVAEDMARAEAAGTVEQESPRVAKAISAINKHLEDLAEALEADKQEIEIGYLKESKRTKKLRQHDFFAEMEKNQIPKFVTMTIDAMTSKEMRRFLEAKDKKGVYDWSQIVKEDLSAYIRAKYSTNKGRWLQLTPEEFIEVRGRDKIKYEDAAALERMADVAATLKSDIQGTYESSFVLDNLGLQSAYERIARYIRNRKVDKVYTNRQLKKMKRNVHDLAKEVWGKNYETEYNKVKKTLFGEEVSSAKLNGPELKKLELFLEGIKNEAVAQKGGSKTEVVRKKVAKKNYYGEGEHLYHPEVTEFEENIMKRTAELSDKWYRQFRKKIKGTKATAGGAIETPLRLWEEIGPAKKLIYDPFMKAEKTAEHRFQDLKKEFKAKYRNYCNKQAEHNMTHYAYSKQKYGREILEATDKKIPESLTPQEQAAYDYIRNKLDEVHGELNKVREASGLPKIPYVKDYFTFMKISTNLAREGVSLNDALFNERYAKAKETPFPFKKRGKPAVELRSDGFNVFEEYMKMAYMHIEGTPVIAKGRQLVETANLANYKPHAHAFMVDWMDAVTGRGLETNFDMMDRAAQLISTNLVAATLSGMFRTAVIQPSAIVNTYTVLGERYTIRGICDLWTDGKPEFAMKHSNIINRMYDVTINDVMTAPKKIKTVLAKKGMKGVEYLDKKTALATWMGAYDKAIASKRKGGMELSHADAVVYADDVVVRTQASARKAHITPIQHTAGGKILTIFQTFILNNFEFLVKDVLGQRKHVHPELRAELGVKQPGKMNVAKNVFRLIAAYTLFNVLYEDGLKIQSPFPTPLRAIKESIDEGDSAAMATAKAGRELLDLIPFLSNLRYGSSLGGPFFELLQEGAEIVSEEPGIKRHPLGLAAKLTGVPYTSQIEKTAYRLKRGQSLPAAIIGQKMEKKKSTVFSRSRRSRRRSR